MGSVLLVLIRIHEMELCRCHKAPHRPSQYHLDRVWHPPMQAIITFRNHIRIHIIRIVTLIHMHILFHTLILIIIPILILKPNTVTNNSIRVSITSNNLRRGSLLFPQITPPRAFVHRRQKDPGDLFLHYLYRYHYHYRRR